MDQALQWTNFSQSLWAETEFSKKYLELADLIIPDRRYHFFIVHSFMKHFGKAADLKVCDLGCGDGALGHEILKARPGIDLTLVDGSQEMLTAAVARIGNASNIKYVPATFEAITTTEGNLGSYDFIVSSFAIHHLTPAERSGLFKKLFTSTRPGGWFINIDTVLPDNPALTDWQYELWREWIKEYEKKSAPAESKSGIPDQARSNPDNKLAPLGEQMKALGDAGFRNVDSLYRNGIFAVYCGQRA